MVPDDPRLIYKICAAHAWDDAIAAGAFRGSAVDRRDGFIHFSTADQLGETLRRHFVGQRDLVVVAVEPGTLGGALRWEPSRGGALFPHLYADLAVGLARWVSAIDAPSGGVFPCALGTSGATAQSYGPWMSADSPLSISKLGFPWQTSDPFLFCVHHDDAYPAGNDALGPAASLVGRSIGNDFAGKDGWRMYHGDVVPGFPQHPHRGFETVTVVRNGTIDHSDSLGATARFGPGDVQWLTAGKGIVHAEMFPLLDPGAPNPLELFQIWLNLPSASKMVAPHFAMLWNEEIPKRVEGGTEVILVAGRMGDARAPAPPPHSWAAKDENEVGIWTIGMAPFASWLVPAVSAGVDRSLYVYRGDGVRVAGRAVTRGHRVEGGGAAPMLLENGAARTEILVLQGRPIGEAVAAQGPFVMNTAREIEQAFEDYRRTRFGGWPWPSQGPVHVRDAHRFAVHGDGRREERPRGT
jgi:quercetin 2,3-dioxygenase